MERIKPLSVLLFGEKPADILKIQELIALRKDLKLFETTLDIDDANFLVKRYPFNIVFIDICEESNSLKKLNINTNSSGLIISSISGSHAVEAFEIGARDYLLKPIMPERFNRAIDRAIIFQECYNQRKIDSYDIVEKYNIFYDRLQNEYRLNDSYYEICKLILKEKNRKEILKTLQISENTLKVYLRDIYSRTIEARDRQDENTERKNKFHQLYLFLSREFSR